MNKKIEAMIYQLRGHRVMLDSDLALLYGVETKVLNQAVKRNIERFPEDFLIVPNSNELATLRSQIVTLGGINPDNHIFKFSPHLFTENGVAMLSSVLKSKQAIQINISIMRTFNKLRSYHALEATLSDRVGKLEKNTNQFFKIILERMDSLEEVIYPKLSPNRKKIGLKSKDS